jgi:hypothetical protein
MTAKLHRVRLLKVMRTPDAMHWTSKLVGEYVPLLGHDRDGYRSREPEGYTNFVPDDCARVVHVFVDQNRLREYPYKYAKADTRAPYRTPEAVIAGLAKPQGCAGSCERMGICQALDDCQDKQRIDAQLAKGTVTGQVSPGQSHRASAVEAGVNIVVGFAVSVGITAVLLPAFGHQVTMAQNVAMTSVFTVASFARAYGLRRLFNWLQCRGKP